MEGYAAELVSDFAFLATPRSRSNGATFSMDDPVVRVRLLVGADVGADHTSHAY